MSSWSWWRAPSRSLSFSPKNVSCLSCLDRGPHIWPHLNFISRDFFSLRHFGHLFEIASFSDIFDRIDLTFFGHLKNGSTTKKNSFQKTSLCSQQMLASLQLSRRDNLSAVTSLSCSDEVVSFQLVIYCTGIESFILMVASAPSKVRICAVTTRPFTQWNIIFANLEHSNLEIKDH